MTTKLFLGDSTVLRGRKIAAERSAVYDKNMRRGEGRYVITYKPHGGMGEELDVNTLVYELMIVAAYDMLELNKTVLGGDYTAAELAGNIGYIPMFDKTNADYIVIKIEAKTFSCSFEDKDIFSQMAEWEGVAGITPKQAHRFHVEGKEVQNLPPLKPYKRHRGYTTKKVSYAAEERRIADKLLTIGRLEKGLNSEGMRKALSLLTAIRSAGKIYNYDTAAIAERVMSHWHWQAYRKEKGAQPISFTAQDFNYGPEIWKQVDEKYATELLVRFKKFLADNPAPTWIKKDDFVQLKNQATAPKKWQGKLKVERVYAELGLYCDKIIWCAQVCTTKGRWDFIKRDISHLEPWVEPEKQKKTKPTKPKDKTTAKPMPTTKPLSLSEQLRKALLERMAA